MNEFIYLGVCVLIMMFLVAFGFHQLAIVARVDRVVLVSSKTKYINQPFQDVINKYIDKTEETNFVELGSGYAEVTTMAAENYKWKSITAIEMDFFAVFVARFKNKFRKLPITFLKSDVFKCSIPQNAFIYCYLSGPVLKQLLHTGAFDSALVLSLSFLIDDRTPIMEYKITGFQKKLYVYDFRSLQS